VKRKAGEEWLVTTEGAYLPNIDEVVVDRLKAFVISDVLALHLRATRTFDDAYGKHRKAGEEWLVTVKLSKKHTHILDVYEEFVREVGGTILNEN